MTTPSVYVLIHRARFALGLTQKALAERLGASERTSVRWSSGSHPGNIRLRHLAALVHPVDAGLAQEIAEYTGTTLVRLGLGVTPPKGPRLEVSPRRALDAVVCAVAETLDVSPRVLRPALLAALRTMREVGLTLDDAENVIVEATASLPQEGPVSKAPAPKTPVKRGRKS